jgi:hypothetical protein
MFLQIRAITPSGCSENFPSDKTLDSAKPNWMKVMPAPNQRNHVIVAMFPWSNLSPFSCCFLDHGHCITHTIYSWDMQQYQTCKIFSVATSP